MVDLVEAHEFGEVLIGDRFEERVAAAHARGS
jgi:hypothetical protein